MVLGVQESPGQGARVARGKRFYPPPGRKWALWDPTRKLEKFDGTTGKRENYHKKNLRTTIGKREECRMEERAPAHAQMAQGAGGYRVHKIRSW